MSKDSAYSYGFIYIDGQAGLTLNYEGIFKISNAGVFIPKKLDSASIKYRLQANQVRVALIPETRFGELKITATPDWLKYYKTDTTSVARLYRWGFLYNSYDEYRKALTYLERAQKIDPSFKGLGVELGFAYNALEQYDKAITALQSAVETAPDKCYLYKELSFAQNHSGQLSKAAETCEKGIAVCSDKQMKSEIAYNMAYQYYKGKDKQGFKYWADQTERWANKDSEFMIRIHKMEADMEK